MDKDKLKKILAGISNFNSGLGDAFKSVEKEMQRVADKLREESEIKTIDHTKKKIQELKNEIQSALESLLNSFDVLKKELGDNEKNLKSILDSKLDSLRNAVSEFRVANSGRLQVLADEITLLKEDIKEISERKIKIPNFTKDIQKAELELGNMILKLKEEGGEQLERNKKDFQDALDKLNEDIKNLRRDAMSAIAGNRGGIGGGNANRNILVGGNSSTLSRYTDLNLIAGTNVTLTATNNDNLKTTNLTIAATGGSGTNRNISTVSVSSVLAAAATTDYVIVASAGVQLTMPTAVSNTNLYTIKNSAASSVMVAAAGAQTIDGSANITLTTQYTAVDLISDDANWHVT